MMKFTDDQCVFVGIDVSKKFFDVALLSEEQEQGVLEHFENTLAGYKRLRRWVESLAKGGAVHVCLEATGTYHEALACELHGWVKSVAVVNPRRIKAFGESELRRAKNDRIDALLIVRFLASQRPEAWTPPRAAERELKELCRRRESLIARRTAESNRLQEAQSALVKASIRRQLRGLNNEIDRVRRAISEIIKNDRLLRENAQLLCTIPGIGEVTAANLLAEIGSIDHYESARQLPAQAGLSPRRHTSGSSIYKRGGMCRIGSSRLRAALYMPAMTATRCNPIIRAFAQRLAQSGKPPKLIIGAAMRKLLHIVFGVLKHQQPFNPKYLNPNS